MFARLPDIEDAKDTGVMVEPRCVDQPPVGGFLEVERGMHTRIARAMEAAGRTDEPALVVVTKFFPASDVDLLAGLGVTQIGENHDQEAAAKCAELASRGRLTVHFIGQLQSNKAPPSRAMPTSCSPSTAPRWCRPWTAARARPAALLEVTVQVNLDQAQGRGGVAPGQARELADLVAGSSSLTLRGVMAVAPLGGDPRSAFARVRAVADGILADHPGATWMSAGMSGDLEAAVAEGATHLRVGSAILGSRQPHR